MYIVFCKIYILNAVVRYLSVPSTHHYTVWYMYPSNFTVIRLICTATYSDGKILRIWCPLVTGDAKVVMTLTGI